MSSSCSLMERNRLCSLCSINPAHQFCICSNLPLLCTSCRPTHETKPGFHFALPIAGFDYVTPQYQPQYRLWLVCLSNSHEKLRENLLLVDKCRAEVEVEFAHIQAQFETYKDKLLQSLEEAKGILRVKIEEAIRETSENAYLENYQHSTHLASLVWNHGSIQSSEPIPALTYQVKTDVEAMQDLLSVSFQTSIPEFSHFNSYSKRADLKQEIADLQAKLAEKNQEETSLTIRSHILETEISPLKSVPSQAELPSPHKPIKSEAIPDNKPEKRKRDPSAKLQAAVKQIKCEKSDNPKSKRDDIFKVLRPAKEDTSKEQKLSIAIAANSPAPRTGNSLLHRYSECQRCHQVYTDKDKDWMCIHQCHCKHCNAALSASGSKDHCLHCFTPYRRKQIQEALSESARCVCCGINYPESQMIAFETHQCPTKPSNRPAIKSETDDKAGNQANHCPACSVPALSGTQVKCCECNEVYRVSSEVYERIKAIPKLLQSRACCTFEAATAPCRLLSCGHLVCERHVYLLKKCRVCHLPARLP